MISLIVIMDRNHLIGTATGMPWHLPADLKRFRKLTMGKPIVMGRTTFEHIGRPLDGRTNIVLTRRPDFQAEGVQIVHSWKEAVQTARQAPGGDEVMVIGGGEVYREALSDTDRIYLTIIEGDFTGTTYFPKLLPLEANRDWKETHREEVSPDAKNQHAHQFVILERQK
jgi:dihydrofolate reductase